MREFESVAIALNITLAAIGGDVARFFIVMSIFVVSLSAAPAVLYIQDTNDADLLSEFSIWDFILMQFIRGIADILPSDLGFKSPRADERDYGGSIVISRATSFLPNTNG